MGETIMPISRIESQLREKLAILHRVINHFGQDDLGEKSILILKNHGLITTANTIESTIYKHYYLEKCIDIQLKILFDK